MRSLWKLMQKMPSPVRYYIIRRIFTFSYELPEGITIQVAESAKDIEEAFHLVHDGFVERNLMDQNESKLRVNKFFALPTTTVIVCKYHDQVIATCSVIQDSNFGLPTDEYRDLNQFRDKDLKLVEVSGLAIEKSWRNKKGQLMIPLSKYMWEYVHFCLKADAIVISTADYAKDFYRGLFLFEPLDQDKVVEVKSVKKNKTVSQILFLKPFLERLEKTYKHVPKERSLWELSKHVYPGFKYPERPYHYASDPVLKPQELDYFFSQKSHVLKSLSTSEKIYLAGLYHFNEFKKVILSDQDEATPIMRRIAPRAPVACKAKILNSFVRGEVREVSRSGMKLFLKSDEFKMGEEVSIEIQLNDFKSVTLKTLIKWKSGSEVGLQLLESNQTWDQFISAIENRFPSDAVQLQRKTS